jgi:four helix bundle protein
LVSLYDYYTGQEGWRKRKYPKSFISKLTDSEGEAAETQVWLDFSLKCNYINEQEHEKLYDKYEHIIAMLINMSTKPEQWKF